MAELSDFLGHILEEITRARVSADAEAVRTAKRYASDPDGLLRYFPVPRVRLPNVEITAPMIVSIVPEGHVEKTDPDLLSRTIAADLFKMLTRRKIKITTTEIIKIIKADPSLSKGYVSQSSADILSVQVGNQIKTPASKAKGSEEIHAEVVALIRQQIALTLQTLPLSPVGIGIDARTSVVKEFSQPAGQGANVLYVKMSISEDALEIEFEQPSEPVPDGKPPSLPGIKRLSPE
jgi:hypothetical protein